MGEALPEDVAGATSRPGPARAADRLTTGPEQPRLSMRHRLARLGATRNGQAVVLDPLMKAIRANHPKADLALVERAYRTAEHFHRGQTRKSGDPYITHPLAVTTILAELGMTEATLVAALLHDTVEDTAYTLVDLTRDFGEEVALLVDGVTKLDKVTYGENTQAETIRKMIVAMSRDIRVLVIKLADRLHNMRTLHHLRHDKQARIARETLEIYAPLAHRLGMNAIKWELEDLAFSVLHPKVYDEIVHLVAERAPAREESLREIQELIEADLKAAKIKASVTGRPKHYYSIYQKMIVRGRDFSDIYDLVALRILVEDQQQCYAVMGILHARWRPLPGRFKDYISMPKFNLYQSLHTTVLGPHAAPVELQIRTWDMHRKAEYGVAAHWKYKALARDGSAPDDLSWVQNLSEWQRETADPEEFLDALRFQINSTEVYAFTPRGDVIALPQGATPVDFAYAVHTEVGHRCVGAKVNGRLVPLESELRNGDVVDVQTSKADGAGPSRDWLNFVTSPRARNKIRQWFTKERREEAIERGKDLLARQLRRSGQPLQRLLTHERLTSVATEFRVSDVTGLYAGIGEGTVAPQAVVQRLVGLEGDSEDGLDEAAEDRSVLNRVRRPRGKQQSGNDSGIAVHGDTDMWVKLARCCTPVPGDEILGFITRGSGVSVHTTSCPNASALQAQPERLVDVSWAPTPKSTFLVSIQVEALDRNGLLSDITRSISDQHVSIQAASLSTSPKDHTCRVRLSFETPDPTHLDHLIGGVRRVPGVFDVFRVQA